MSLAVPAGLLEQAQQGEVEDGAFLDCVRACDAMRAAVERHYGVRLAFQNCHRAAVFRPEAAAALAEFTSPGRSCSTRAPTSSTASPPRPLKFNISFPNGPWPPLVSPAVSRTGGTAARAATDHSVRRAWPPAGGPGPRTT